MDDPEIPNTGAVFTFGKSKFADNAPSKFWIKNDEVKLISCGDEHTAVVTQSGRIFTFGCNEWGQLGLGHNNNVIKPSCIKVLKPDQVVAVSCGRSHTVVGMRSGEVWAMGCNSEGQLGVGRGVEWVSGPRQVVGLPHHVVQLATGAGHSLALTGEGRVWVWGSNTEGQLGLGEDSEETVFTPTELPLQDRVTQIACGYYHSALVTSQGHLLTFGEEEGGKLGLGESEESDCDTPRLVNIPEPVTAVRCGASHTLALTNSGKVYSFGQSSHGQLGLGNTVLESALPRLVVSLDQLKVTSLSCGENHSLVTTSSGHLYTFGDGRHGKLCLDLETLTNQFSPAHVDRFSGFRVRMAECGGCHTMILGVPRQEDDHQEEMDLRKVSEVNSQARERRRSGLKEESRLPPLRSKLPPLAPSHEETDLTRQDLGDGDGEKKDGDAKDGDEHNPQDNHEGKEEVEGREEKEGEEEREEEEAKSGDPKAESEAESRGDKSGGGRISKFFSSFKRKKQSEDHSQGQSNGDVSEEKKEEIESPVKSEGKESEEQSPEKAKKRVSFFRQFSKEKKEEEKSELKPKTPMKSQQESLNEDEENVSLREEEKEEKDNDDDSEDSEEISTDSEESEMSTTRSSDYKHALRERPTENSNVKPVVRIINPSEKPKPRQNNTKVKSKSCVIL